jgi:nitrite reductase/ring-hydroxylating ferredoxin subunit
MFVDVGALGDFEEGVPKPMSVEGREIGIVRWRGEAFALRNICPHEYGPVCAGYAMPMIVGDTDGVIDIDEDHLVVVCPWHGWEFNARDGRAAWGKSSYKLKTYPTKIEADRILVDIGKVKAQPGRDQDVAATAAGGD